MYFDIYFGVCHPLIVYTMYAEFNEGVIMYEKHIPVWRPHGTSFSLINGLTNRLAYAFQ